MGLLLDTNVLIRAERLARSERGGLDFTPWAGRGHALISAVTASELLVGVHRANSEARRIRRSAPVLRSSLRQPNALNLSTAIKTIQDIMH